jgi:hypothetical protein
VRFVLQLMSPGAVYGLPLQQVEGSGTSWVGRGEGLECDATVVTTNTSITVKRSNVSQFGVMANEQRWTSFVNDFVADNSARLEILERDTNLTFAVAVVRGGYQGIDPPTNEEIIAYYRTRRLPAALPFGPAQHNDEASTPSSLGVESNGAMQQNRVMGPAGEVSAQDTAPRNNLDENSSIGSMGMGSVGSFAVSARSSLGQAALERNDGNGAHDSRIQNADDGNGAPLAQNERDHVNLNREGGNGGQEGRFGLEQFVFDQGNFNNDNGDSSVGRFVTKCTHGTG